MRTARATMPDMTPPAATYADFEAVPEHVRAELIDGELVLQAYPSVDHQSVLVKLTSHLDGRFSGKARDDGDRPGGWVVLSVPELWLGSPDPKTRVLAPDLAAWRRERWPRVRETHGLTVVPDWVCEILSPSTQRYDRLRKATVYADAGVAWYWLLDPVQRFVEAYERRDGVWVRVAAFDADEKAALPPFGGAPADVGAWWADLDLDE